MNPAFVHPKIEPDLKTADDFLGFKVITDTSLPENIVLVRCDDKWIKIEISEKKDEI